MKMLIYVALLLVIVGCSEQSKNFIKVSPLEVIIKEDKISLKLDGKGFLSQNGEALGRIEGNKVLDLEGNEVYSINNNYTVFNIKKDTVADYRNKKNYINDGFFGVIKWSTSGNLETADGDDLSIQIVPNDSTLYRTASLVLLYGEYMKN